MTNYERFNDALDAKKDGDVIYSVYESTLTFITDADGIEYQVRESEQHYVLCSKDESKDFEATASECRKIYKKGDTLL